LAYQTGDTILDDHYNGFADTNSPNNINKIWGTGNGTYGYGQSNTVSTVSAGGTVQASQWNTLLSRMQSIGDHQGTNVTTADSGQLVAGDPIQAILEISTDITSFGNNRYNVAAANLTETTNPNTVNRTFTGSWTTNTIHEVSFTFASSDAARYFFNGGGKITHVWNLSGHTSDDKANEWVDLFNTKAATFTFSGNNDSLSGSGTQDTDKNEGFWSSDTDGTYTIYQKQFADSSPYTSNYCQWEVKVTGTAGDNGGKGEVITIKATARDDAADSSDDAALDQVDGNLSSSWTFSKPNTTQLNNDAVGTITAAEVSQTQA
tara:strand:- start:2099 stop:3055 length:957 start_codon:yes stop_codon:yes gene_type:complete